MITERKLIEKYLRDINRLAAEINRIVTIMEICGGHTNIIMRHGIREIMPSNVRLISGPGCPVCVSSQRDIDAIIELASNNIPVATYGDMLRVPGSKKSLEDARAVGGKIFEVYSTTEVISLKKRYPDIIFFGIGFETTAPMTAYLLKNNVCVYSVHKLIPPAMKLLINGEIAIDGFINPGHVSTIIGVKAYRDIKIPQVITGFTPERVLRGISLLLELIKKGKKTVINGYPEAVTEEGNKRAQKLLNEVFYVSESQWRGLGYIPKSGLEVRDPNLNAKILYENIIKNIPEPSKTGCRCGDILKGLIEPVDCPLYSVCCKPESPMGACMVSEEGSCAIYYRYGEINKNRGDLSVSC